MRASRFDCVILSRDIRPRFADVTRGVSHGVASSRARWLQLLLPCVLYVGAATLALMVDAPLRLQAQASSASSVTDAQLLQRARVLEGRLLAPCCWNQTLDVHDSEISRSIHQEIMARLSAGESAASIEASLIERHGERLRAVPIESPLSGLALWAMAAILAAGLGLFVVGRRWRRAGEKQDKLEPVDASLSAYDERLARELDALD